MNDDKLIEQIKNEAASDLRRLQKMPYDWKVEHAKQVVREFVEEVGLNKVYVSFSGGKDSLVLLHIVRSIYPSVPAVFVNTGVEFPEQVKFVRTFENLIELHPVKHFPKIIKEEGIVYPSKEVAMYIRDYKKGCKYAVNGMEGKDRFGKDNRYKKRFVKWKYLVDCGVKISPDCCNLMKETPLKNFEKENCINPFIGTRAEESFRRSVGWMKGGCNVFKGKVFKSKPLSLWTEQDVLRYIVENRIALSPCYGDVVKVDDKYTLTGMVRTGCMFCPIPIAHGDYRNINYARENYPKLYDVIMEKHGLKKILELLNQEKQLSLF